MLVVSVVALVLLIAVLSYSIGKHSNKQYDYESATEDAYKNWQQYVYSTPNRDSYIQALSEAFAEWAEYAYMEGCDDTREKFTDWYNRQVKSQQSVLDGLLKKVESDRKARDVWSESL